MVAPHVREGWQLYVARCDVIRFLLVFIVLWEMRRRAVGEWGNVSIQGSLLHKPPRYSPNSEKKGLLLAPFVLFGDRRLVHLRPRQSSSGRIAALRPTPRIGQQPQPTCVRAGDRISVQPALHHIQRPPLFAISQ